MTNCVCWPLAPKCAPNRAKQVIFRQGDLADSGFVITEGQIRMTISENGF